jgi:glycosyltransferase involved in cell wall biosynthesis
MPPRIKVLTHIPSPYQVELFDAIAQSGQLELEVSYLYSASPMRSWAKPQPRHDHVFLNDDPILYSELEQSLGDFDLVVFHYYRNPYVITLLKQRAKSGKAWCFWGERPGYHKLGPFGALYRKWSLSTLNHSQAPIWGMGSWAVDQYRRDYGTARLYCNVPYFSDLARFKRIPENHRSGSANRVFLFSGSLIHRKGVDLLARAFKRLAAECPNVSLKLVGEGEMRSKLERQLSDFADRIEFVGFQEWENLPQFYHAADILCVPSRYDGWNLVVPEGLAAGLPVISTDQTGAALDLIKTGRNGWIVPANDTEALYESMRAAALLPQVALRERSIEAERSILSHSIDEGVERFQQAVDSSLGAFHSRKDRSARKILMPTLSDHKNPILPGGS